MQDLCLLHDPATEQVEASSAVPPPTESAVPPRTENTASAAANASTGRGLHRTLPHRSFYVGGPPLGMPHVQPNRKQPPSIPPFIKAVTTPATVVADDTSAAPKANAPLPHTENLASPRTERKSANASATRPSTNHTSDSSGKSFIPALVPTTERPTEKGKITDHWYRIAKALRDKIRSTSNVGPGYVLCIACTRSCDGVAHISKVPYTEENLAAIGKANQDVKIWKCDDGQQDLEAKFCGLCMESIRVAQGLILSDENGPEEKADEELELAKAISASLEDMSKDETTEIDEELAAAIRASLESESSRP